jgi:hypothetical protein
VRIAIQIAKRDAKTVGIEPVAADEQLTWAGHGSTAKTHERNSTHKEELMKSARELRSQKAYELMRLEFEKALEVGGHPATMAENVMQQFDPENKLTPGQRRGGLQQLKNLAVHFCTSPDTRRNDGLQFMYPAAPARERRQKLRLLRGGRAR